VLLVLLVLGTKMAYSQAVPQGGATLPGIVKTAELAKTNVFELKLSGMTSEAQASAFDALMLSKHGVLTCVTNPTTHVCRVEALKRITERNLEDVVTVAGYKIAKTFND
jgi:hypothetical protein